MKIALIGYGKMGHIIEEIAISRGHEIVSKIDRDNQDDFTSNEFASADVAIEFSTPATAVNNYMRAFEAGVPVVSGTTGWLDQIDMIKDKCNHGATFFYASNFSLGVNIFFALNKYLARIMNHFTDQYNVSMTEIHHIHKLDHPSGTAITIADDIINGIDAKNAWTEDTNHTDNQLQITAIREGEVPGTHIVKYDSEVDTITIEHEAKSRRGFALGAVLAAEFTKGRKGFLSMSDMLPFLND